MADVPHHTLTHLHHTAFRQSTTAADSCWDSLSMSISGWDTTATPHSWPVRPLCFITMNPERACCWVLYDEADICQQSMCAGGLYGRQGGTCLY